MGNTRAKNADALHVDGLRLKDLDELKRLLAEGSDPNANTNLLLAIHEDSKEKLNVLLRYGANVNERDYATGNGVIHECARIGNNVYPARYASMIKTLAKRSGNVNAVNYQGEAPLHLAWRPEIVRALLDAGASTLVENTKSGNSVYAGKNPEGIAMLIEAERMERSKAEQGALGEGLEKIIGTKPQTEKKRGPL